MKYDAIISGYVSMDRVIKIASPAKVGFTSIVTNKDNSKINYGGCSTNIAYLLASLGKKALPLIRVGENDLEETGFYQYLKDGGVCMEATQIVSNETTSNCYLLLDNERNHITIFYPGAMDGKYAGNMDIGYFENSKVGILTIGSYEDNVEFVKNCKKANTPLIFGMKSDFDGFPVPFLKEILLYSKIIFTNEVEADEICELYGFKSICDLFELGNAQIIVTTLGKRGSKWYEKAADGSIKSGSVIAAELGPVVDTTGGGDAYIAGFVYAWLNGKDTESCCNHGSVLSSFIIEKVGCITNTPNQEQFDKRYKQLIG